MTKPAKADTTPEHAEGPAVVTPLHVWRRPATDDQNKPILGKVGCTKLSPLEAQFEHGKLAGGNSKYDAQARLSAGLEYSKLWDTAQSSGRDSTQALNLPRGGGSGIPLSQAQSEAIRALVAVESHMGQRDRIIVRMVCGQGHFPSEAVAMISSDYAKATSPRFREALDALIEAFEAVRRRPTFKS